MRLLAAIMLACGLTAGVGCRRAADVPRARSPEPEPAARQLSVDNLMLGQPARASHAIALVAELPEHRFYRPLIREAQSAAERLGASLEVHAPDGDDNSASQAQIVRDLVDREIKAIVIVPAAPAALAPALRYAQQRGVTMVVVDRRVPTIAAAGFVGADDEQGGAAAGAVLIDALGGVGDVAILISESDDENAATARRAFESAVAGKLTVVDVETVVGDGSAAVVNLQQAYPELRGIFAASDRITGIRMLMADGGSQSSRVLISGGGESGSPVTAARYVAYVEVHRHPGLMGRYGVALAVRALEGSVPKGGEMLIDGTPTMGAPIPGLPQ